MMVIKFRKEEDAHKLLKRVKKMREEMSALKNIEIIEPIVTVESTVKPETVEALKVLAAELIG